MTDVSNPRWSKRRVTEADKIERHNPPSSRKPPKLGDLHTPYLIVQSVGQATSLPRGNVRHECVATQNLGSEGVARGEIELGPADRPTCNDSQVGQSQRSNARCREVLRTVLNHGLHKL